MSYSTALSQLRRCLATYTRLEVADVRKFALHSLKTTPLTWGLQLQLGVEVRAAQGHHRVRNSSGCVEKYRRDDVLPALRCQRSIVRAVQNGWVPCTALARGLVAVQEQDPRELLLAGIVRWTQTLKLRQSLMIPILMDWMPAMRIAYRAMRCQSPPSQRVMCLSIRVHGF